MVTGLRDQNPDRGQARIGKAISFFRKIKSRKVKKITNYEIIFENDPEPREKSH